MPILDNIVKYRHDGAEEMSLADNKCVPCRGGVLPMQRSEAEQMLNELEQGWLINDQGHLERLYTFQNFALAMSLANTVADIAEEEGHHPDLYVAWGRCKIEIWTHKISGLTASDFYLAAKVDRAIAQSRAA